jgi:hypothetical protein
MVVERLLGLVSQTALLKDAEARGSTAARANSSSEKDHSSPSATSRYGRRQAVHAPFGRAFWTPPPAGSFRSRD